MTTMPNLRQAMKSIQHILYQSCTNTYAVSHSELCEASIAVLHIHYHGSSEQPDS